MIQLPFCPRGKKYRMSGNDTALQAERYQRVQRCGLGDLGGIACEGCFVLGRELRQSNPAKLTRNRQFIWSSP